MRCFNHPESDAVGTCKACHKGLCHLCVTDLGHGLACKDEHEQLVAGYDKLLNTQSRAMFAFPWFNYLFPAVFIFLGAVLMWGGLKSGQGLTSVSFLYGVGCFAFGVIVLVRVRKVLGSRK